MSWLEKFPAKYCIQDVYRQNIEPKRFRECQGGVGPSRRSTPLPPVPRKILKTMSWLKKFLAKYCIQDVYRQNIEPKRFRGCQRGVGDPLGNAVWQFEGLHYLHQTYRRHERAGSARRGGSCPAVKVWTCWATRSSHESRVCRFHFAPLPETGMRNWGGCQLSAVSIQSLCRNPRPDFAGGTNSQKTSAVGAKELSPALQRWVKWEIRQSPVGTAEVATQSLQPL